MYQISREKVNLSLEKKLWIIRKNKEHKKFLHRDLLWILELETKKAFKLQKLTLGAVVKILYCANS